MLRMIYNSRILSHRLDSDRVDWASNAFGRHSTNHSNSESIERIFQFYEASRWRRSAAGLRGDENLRLRLMAWDWSHKVNINRESFLNQGHSHNMTLGANSPRRILKALIHCQEYLECRINDFNQLAKLFLFLIIWKMFFFLRRTLFKLRLNAKMTQKEMFPTNLVTVIQNPYFSTSKASVSVHSITM